MCARWWKARLRGGDVGGLAASRRLSAGFCSAREYENVSGQGRPFIARHGVEVRRRRHVGLAAGEEHDARLRRRHGALEHAQGALGDLVHARLARVLLARHHHARLQDQVLERDVVRRHRGVGRAQRRLGHLLAALDRCGRRRAAPRARSSARWTPPGRAPRSARARARWRTGRCGSECPSPMVITARHLAKRAPSLK